MSAIKEMSILAAAVPDAASLAWGLPSFRTPANIRAVVEKALAYDPDIGKYALPDGLPELRRAVVIGHERHTGVRVDADRNVMISAGNMQAINALLHVILDDDDEVILTDPGFASHFQQIRLCGGRPVPWALDESAGWALDVDSLPGLITARTRAILLVSPSNPTGSIFGRDALTSVARIAAERNLLVVVDDPYSFLTFENSDSYFNLAAAAEYRDRIAYCFTFSKLFAMSGWRLGYMILPAELKRQVMKVHDATIICTPRISQAAGIEALLGDHGPIHEFQRILAERRRLICERLDRVSDVFEYVRPQGAYYVFPRIVAEHDDSLTFSMQLLDQAKVAVTPGSAFGARGEHHVRMAFCVTEQTIDTAFDRIERWAAAR